MLPWHKYTEMYLQFPDLSRWCTVFKVWTSVIQHLLLTCSTGMRFLSAMSSTVSLPSVMMPTLAAIALAVIGWSPVTMTTWGFKTGKCMTWTKSQSENKLSALQKSLLACHFFLFKSKPNHKPFMRMRGNVNTPWCQRYDISSLHRVQWLSGGQSLRWDQRSTIRT